MCEALRTDVECGRLKLNAVAEQLQSAEHEKQLALQQRTLDDLTIRNLELQLESARCHEVRSRCTVFNDWMLLLMVVNG